ncbi:hypothetical protein [Candidatus Lokiarchaeum ossiferum]|uniref:hypothetical protein n=1 Tax=Candidatus Lokiarchaeum ossiferum TaxID=2951803 RepID=UPI00352C6B0D
MAGQYTDMLNNLIGVFGIGIVIGMIVVSFILNVLCMKWGIARVDGKENEFGSVFVTTLLSFVCGLIPCGCFLSAYIISTRHKVTYGKGLLALILAGLLPIIVMIIIILIFVFATLGISEFMAIFGF